MTALNIRVPIIKLLGPSSPGQLGEPTVSAPRAPPIESAALRANQRGRPDVTKSNAA